MKTFREIVLARIYVYLLLKCLLRISSIFVTSKERHTIASQSNSVRTLSAYGPAVNTSERSLMLNI